CDRRAGRMVLCAGVPWVLGPGAPAGGSDLGGACSGATVPVLTEGAPVLGNGAFAIDLLHAAPSAACLFGLSLGNASQPPGGGCTLELQQPVVTALAITNGGGFASLRVPIADATALRGLVLFDQAAVADGSGPLGGVSVTAARRIAIGD